VRPYLSPIAGAYAAADLAVTRSGALTIAELSAWGIPAVLVPLPTAAGDHQTANARTLAAAGAALMIPQQEFSADRLDSTVRSLVADPPRLASLSAAMTSRARPNAAAEIATRLLALLATPGS